MKSFLSQLCLLILGISVSVFYSCQDDLEYRLSALEDRVADLETLCRQANENIAAIQVILDAVDSRDYITEVSPIKENDNIVGYTIEFARNDAITVYNGMTPDVSIAEKDGKYYWMLNAEFLTDKDGNLLPVTGIAPEFKIVDGRWQISTDAGNTWTDYGEATGDSFFENIEVSDTEVKFILSDGQEFTVKKGAYLDIEFEEDDLVVMDANASRKIGYEIVSDSETIEIEVISSQDIKARISKQDLLTGTIDIITGAKIDEYSKVVVFVSDGTQVIMRTFSFEETGLMVSDSSDKAVPSDGGTVELEFLSNTDCYVEIPQEAASWITVPGTKSLETKSINLSIAENLKERRTANVIVKAEGSDLFLKYTIIQEDNPEFLSNRDKEVALELFRYFKMDDVAESLQAIPFEQWAGYDPRITINSSNRVSGIQLSLSSENEDNQIDFPETISLLSELETLTIVGSPIFSIPDCIGKLEHLKTLSMAHNVIESVSDSIINLKNLEKIDLSYNQLKSFPVNMFKLTKLKHIDLSFNPLNAEIPDKISELANLEYLDLDGCWLTGSIPPQIGSLTKLKFLDLSSGPNEFTRFSGGIPKELGNCVNLEELNLYNSGLSGEIPESMGNLKKLTVLDLAGNQLSGDIPESVTALPVWKTYGWRIIWQEINGPTMSFTPSTLNLVFPEFNTTDLISGANITSDDILHANQLILIYNYYSVPSVTDDEIQNLYNKYYDQGLGFLNISRSDDVTQMIMPLSYNISESATDAAFYVWPAAYLFDSDGNYMDMMSIDYRNEEFCQTIESVLGEGNESQMYTSSDYSKDGEVITYQTATVGQGIDLVFMGDAFVDRDMNEGGAYEEAMEFMIDDLFAYEPYKSLRDRFNIYIVKVVSPNEINATGAVHRIEYDTSVCTEYAQKIPGLNQDRMMVTVYVKYNGGISYTQMISDGSFFSFIKNKGAGVVAHEAGGHGFAGLLDEYVNYPTETATDDDREYLDRIWADYGWGANIDWRDDPQSIKWSKFLSDTRYNDENLGIYEGAFLVGHGLYRATEQSMMNKNDTPFNAPSREAIYKRIMQYSEGDDWQYDYEEFVNFDKSHEIIYNTLPMRIKPANGAPVEDTNTGQPIMKIGSWKDFYSDK